MKTSARSRPRAAALLLAATLLVGMIALPASAEGHHKPAKTRLAGVTKLSGHDLAFTRVYLPRPVRLSNLAFENAAIDISSEGSFAGVVLKQEADEGGAEIITSQIATCLEPPCSSRNIDWTIVAGVEDRGRFVTLPAGNYQIYLYSDGAEVDVILRFKELAGNVTLRPAQTVGFFPYEELEPYLHEDTPEHIYSASVEHSFDRMGITMAGMVFEVEKGSQGEMDSCVERKIAPADAPRPRPELCLLGPGMISSWEDESASDYAVAINYALVNAGDYTHSLNYRAPEAAKAMRGFAFGLHYATGERVGSQTGGLIASG
jgi:hypothetical protein